ncbi:MAG: hypothetical protein GPOALKHO_001929 [Sodalis sp.]|nr:MAG: hypothetical protein GPOALKHO_001929 [Sodalis sp.]
MYHTMFYRLLIKFSASGISTRGIKLEISIFINLNNSLDSALFFLTRFTLIARHKLYIGDIACSIGSGKRYWRFLYRRYIARTVAQAAPLASTLKKILTQV